MKTLFVLFIFLSLPLVGWSQIDSGATARPVPAPVRYLALDVSGPFGGFHRYRFLQGDRLSFKSTADNYHYREPVYAVTDTSFSISMMNEVMNRPDFPEFRFNEVRKIYITRQIPFVSAGALMLPLAGLVFIVADFVNPKSFDGRSGRFVFDSRSLVPGGALMALGGLCYKLSYPRYTVNKNHRLRVLTAL
ncbi:MAG: hypothetical protein H7Z72_10740 [Bacteroidetes bacterium]|nr:hypothetical protein [Fibrella sp.]